MITDNYLEFWEKISPVCILEVKDVIAENIQMIKIKNLQPFF